MYSRKKSSVGLCASIIAKTPLMDYVQISAEIIHGLIEVLRTVAKKNLVDYVRVSAKIIHGFIKDLRIYANTPPVS